MSEKLAAGSLMPEIVLPSVQGGELKIGGGGRWQLVIVYRGKHCPLCKTYLSTLEGLKEEFDEMGVEVMAVSTDPKEKAEAFAKEQELTTPIGYDLSPAQVRELGLYLSEPRSKEETDRPFAEPGAFVVNPQGKIQIIDISNAPFARPSLTSLLRGIAYIREKDYPIRGTA